MHEATTKQYCEQLCFAFEDSAFEMVAYQRSDPLTEAQISAHIELLHEVNVFIENENKRVSKITTSAFDPADAMRFTKGLPSFSEGDVQISASSSTIEALSNIKPFKRVLESWSEEIQQLELLAQLDLDAVINQTEHIQDIPQNDVEKVIADAQNIVPISAAHKTKTHAKRINS